MPDIAKVADRAKLKPRREPYWRQIERGNFLGFRKVSSGTEGTWLARSRDADTGKQRMRALGAFDHLPPSDRYGLASAAALEWFKHLGAGGTDEVVTVKLACERYVEHLKGAGRVAAADDAAARFERWIYPNAKLAGTEVAKLQRRALEEWRRTLARTKVIANPHAEKDAQRVRERARSTVNRDMSPVRAALNLAKAHGATGSDLAWAEALKPFERADGQRETYLSLQQRQDLVAAAPPDLANLLKALAMIPLRPGAVAALRVGDFDPRLGSLRVSKDKAGAGRKLSLPAETATLFKGLAKHKLPGAPLLARADGKPWTKDDWKVPIKIAADAAGLPPETVAYSLRHSAITDLVTGGLDLLTVAQISGTSVVMIERHYGHLRQERAATALAGLAL